MGEVPIGNLAPRTVRGLQRRELRCTTYCWPSWGVAGRPFNGISACCHSNRVVVSLVSPGDLDHSYGIRGGSVGPAEGGGTDKTDSFGFPQAVCQREEFPLSGLWEAWRVNHREVGKRTANADKLSVLRRGIGELSSTSSRHYYVRNRLDSRSGNSAIRCLWTTSRASSTAPVIVCRRRRSH
jgi:hypothetical protein